MLHFIQKELLYVMEDSKELVELSIQQKQVQLTS